MEVFCCDEASMRKITSIDIKNVPENTVFDAAEASAFKDTNVGWTTLPAIAQLAGDIAIVKVSGPLVAGAAGWRRLFGVVGYEDIKAAVVEAMQRDDVNGVLMYYDTPGGAVNGVKPTAEMLKTAGKIKPMVAFAATAASAGYWLAAASGKIFADELSMIGSIGTIMQFVDATEYHKTSGIKFNIIKSGSLKMAGNPNEEMSDEARAQFQQVVDDMNAVFYRSMATYRKKPVAQLRADYGDGRAVVAIRAMSNGLVDGLGGMNAAMTELRSQINAKFSQRK